MIIGKFIGVLLVIIAVVTILALLISLFTIGSIDVIHHEWFSYDTFFFNSSGLPVWVISILTFILVGIPFFFLFALGLRILSNNTKTHPFGNLAYGPFDCDLLRYPAVYDDGL